MDIESVKSGPLGNHLESLNRLRAQRIVKMKYQDKLVLELQKSVEVQQHSNKMVRKNLEACVAVSRRSGYIDYMEPIQDDLKKSQSLISQIKTCENDLQRLNEQIKNMSKKTNQIVYSGGSKPNSIAEWLEKNGRPSGDGVARGYMSTFKTTKSRRPHWDVSDNGKVEKPFDRKNRGKYEPRTQVRSAGVSMMKGRMYKKGCSTP